MGRLGQLLEVVLGLWFAGLASIVVVQLFSGRILSAGVLAIPHGPPIGVARLQLVLMTVGIAGAYAGTALMRPAGLGLPDPPMEIVLALLGSHGFYLGGKSGLMRAREVRT